MKIKKTAKLGRIIAFLAIIIITLATCSEPAPTTDPDPVSNPDTVINISAIQGVTVPVNGGTPVTTITENDQYSGTVTWSPNHSAFAAEIVYTATITLTAKTGYTLQGITANFFTVDRATSVSNAVNSSVVTAVFPKTKANNPAVTDYEISGIGTFTYDGNTKVVTIVPISGKSTGAVTVLYNDSDSEPINAGTYTVTFNVAESENYSVANGLQAGTIIINKADGAVVTSPTAITVNATSVTLNTVTQPDNGQIVEYAKSTNEMAPVSGWQTDITLNGLTTGTTYYFFARSAENNNYNAGVASDGTAITTKFSPVATDYDIKGIGSFVYDGTAKTVSISPKRDKSAGAITILYNNSASVPINAGNYAVTFNVAESGNFSAVNGLSAGNIIITKANGATVASTTAATVGVNSVTLNTVTQPSNGQTVEYAKSTTSTAPASGWQTNTTFSGLTAGTAYYFFARSAENNNYNAGTASIVIITTTQQAGINIIKYWVDYNGNIGIERQDGVQIDNNTVVILQGNVITFTPNDNSYVNYNWTLNGVSVGNASEYTFYSIGRDTDKNYIVGLYIEKNGKPYFTQIIVKIRSQLTGTVKIDGNAQVGQTLTANTSSLGGSGTISYEWKRGTTIVGTNSNTYIVQTADLDYAITVTVSRSENFGSVTSSPVTITLPPLTGTVTITGTPQVGQILTANANNLGGSGTISYQWKRGTTNIGTNSSTYTVQSADMGYAITVTVTRSGYSGSVTSSAVTINAPPLTGSVSIIGTALVGQTLTANISSLGGSGTIFYQWKRGGTTNIGTNSSTYTVQAADVGNTITVTVTRSGYSGSVTSPETQTVPSLSSLLQGTWEITRYMETTLTERELVFSSDNYNITDYYIYNYGTIRPKGKFTVEGNILIFKPDGIEIYPERWTTATFSVSGNTLTITVTQLGAHESYGDCFSGTYTKR